MSVSAVAVHFWHWPTVTARSEILAASSQSVLAVKCATAIFHQCLLTANFAAKKKKNNIIHVSSSRYDNVFLSGCVWIYQTRKYAPAYDESDEEYLCQSCCDTTMIDMAFGLTFAHWLIALLSTILVLYIMRMMCYWCNDAVDPLWMKIYTDVTKKRFSRIWNAILYK